MLASIAAPLILWLVVIWIAYAFEVRPPWVELGLLCLFKVATVIWSETRWSIYPGALLMGVLTGLALLLYAAFAWSFFAPIVVEAAILLACLSGSGFLIQVARLRRELERERALSKPLGDHDGER
jgi:hypothetical protein